MNFMYPWIGGANFEHLVKKRVEQTLDSWEDVAWGAHFVNEHCFTEHLKHGLFTVDLIHDVEGQAFFADDWNVMVHFEKCR